MKLTANVVAENMRVQEQIKKNKNKKWKIDGKENHFTVKCKSRR